MGCKKNIESRKKNDRKSIKKPAHFQKIEEWENSNPQQNLSLEGTKQAAYQHIITDQKKMIKCKIEQIN